SCRWEEPNRERRSPLHTPPPVTTVAETRTDSLVIAADLVILPLQYAFIFIKKYDKQYEHSEEFQKELKIKVRELLTEQEWRRRKMQMRVCSNLRKGLWEYTNIVMNFLSGSSELNGITPDTDKHMLATQTGLSRNQ
ncbi:hypothetical protein S83_042166, partial [Arachis hypogaea]